MDVERRANGESGLYRRSSDGRWVAALDVGYQNGRRKRIYFTAKTMTAAAAKLQTAKSNANLGLPPAPRRQTVEQYLDRWLRLTAAPALKPSTWQQYESAIRLHVLPSLGPVQLAKLGPAHLEALYLRLGTGDKRANSAPLGPRSVLYVHRVLHRALSVAERRGELVRNPADLVEAPRVPAGTVKAFDVEQSRRFLAAVDGDPLRALYILALATGMRRGELLALEWGAVDLQTGTVAVRKAMSRVKGGWQATDPKTAGSRRVVKLPGFAVEALRAHRDALPVSPLPTAAVFTTARGNAIDPRNLLRLFKARLVAAGLPPGAFTFHSLRHSSATLQLSLGVPAKVVAEGLGHSRISVTMDTYSHVLPTLQDEAAAKMDRLLGGG